MEPSIFLTVLVLLAKGCDVLAQRVEYFTKSTPTLCTASYLTPVTTTPTITAIETIPSAPIVPSYPNFGGYPFTPPMPMPPFCMGGKDDDDDWHHLLYFLIFALKNRGNGGCGNSYGCGGCGGNSGCGGCGGNCGCGGCGSNCGCGGCGGNCGCGGYGGNCGCSGCGGNYGSGYGGYGCNSGCGCGEVYAYDNNYSSMVNSISNNGNDVVYVPYPIAVPMNSLSSSSSFSYPNMPSTTEGYPSPGQTLPPCNCNCKDPSEICLTIRTECQ
uniref:Uncharacterized protein n=1 Tax=Pararge aegeria TaxID=116150 RepID=S4PCB0_9NEOP